MKLFLFIFFSLYSLNVFPFYLLVSNVPRFSGNPIIVNVVDNNCDNIDMTKDEIKEFAQESLDRFWNSASGTKIQFEVEGFIAAPNNLLITELIEYVPLNKILIGCSTNSSAFSSEYTLASGGLQSDDDGIPQGIVMLNDTTTTKFNEMDRNQQLAIFAHEFGHAIGIGHSDIDYSLMYYAVSETIKRDALAEDDEDAISFLYPHDSELLGLAGSCGTISDVNNDNNSQGPFNFLISFVFGLLFLGLIKVFGIERFKFYF